MKSNMTTSIFRLDEIRCDGTFAEESRDLEAVPVVRGHFSSLEKAIAAMKRNASETYFPEEIYAYLVKEIAVDGNLGDVDWLSVRSYDPSGNLLEEDRTMAIKCIKKSNAIRESYQNHVLVADHASVSTAPKAVAQIEDASAVEDSTDDEDSGF